MDLVRDLGCFFHGENMVNSNPCIRVSTHVDGDGHSSLNDDLNVQGGFHEKLEVEVDVCESQSSCQSFKSL